MFNFFQNKQNKAKIIIIGTGGGGCNSIHRMITSKVAGVTFVACNTDLQTLNRVAAKNKIQLGANVTRGLGAGAKPEVGRLAAEESMAEIETALTGADMVFVTAGMGKGTGTGSAPYIAEIAKRLNILTVGFVTKPFSFEGETTSKIALEGIKQISKNVDSLIVINNEKLLEAYPDLNASEAFQKADETLKQGMQAITDLINVHGEMNTDFADVKTIMTDSGKALMGIGEGQNALEAAQNAINCPLLENSIQGARRLLINIQGSCSLKEINEATTMIKSQVSETAKIIFGISPTKSENIKITIIGCEGSQQDKDRENGYKGGKARTKADENIAALE